jgi:lipoate-protein ligase A
MHDIIALALAECGVAAQPYVPGVNQPPFTGFLCFQHFTAGDLMIDRFKVAGSAQRRLRKALMQHGSILLATSSHAPMLPGIHELSGRCLSRVELCSVMERIFTRATGWPLTRRDWTQAERQRTGELVRDKYGQDFWNRKR